MEMFLLILPVLLLSVVVHEFAHGWVALQQGDTTARDAGRLTLNPAPHLELFGSLLVPLLLWLSPAGFIFGWAKPVPVNPRNFREYRRGDILVSLAGIVSNLILAVVFTVAAVLLVVVAGYPAPDSPVLGGALQMLRFGVFINLILAFFNLIPIPPLDGSHVLKHILPPGVRAAYVQVGRFGILVLLVILFLVPGLLRFFLQPVLLLQRVADGLIQAGA